MKKKVMAAVLAAMALSLTSCGERTDIVDETVISDETFLAGESENRIGCVEGCTCTGCICCGTVLEENSAVPETAATEPAQTEDMSETAETVEGEEQEQLSSEAAQELSQLTDGELKARREQQDNFVEARQLLYSLPNSKDKTSKINQMDRQILANNAYDFTQKNIVFIGDSITEGITSAIDANGNYISYVNYVDSYLHFNNVLNHGKGGRMFATYGGDELSLDKNFGDVTNIDANIIVVFAGVNDYLSGGESKRFGDINDTLSTAGYCGAVRSFMNQLRTYYSDRQIFFVIMYNNSKTAQGVYSDVAGQLTLNDFLEVQRKLAAEYGFNVIELYNIGLMDCTDKESSDFYLRDGLHPNDNGNIILGEHIAAELSLYFGQKEVDQ